VLFRSNAQDVNINRGFKTQLREKLARVKVFLDFIFGEKPKYLGETIDI
jgi:SanA protein